MRGLGIGDGNNSSTYTTSGIETCSQKRELCWIEKPILF
jgi:hypothetical protein